MSRPGEPHDDARGGAAPRVLELPRTVRFGRDYWLGRCTGYRVEAPGGRVGTVESLRFGSRHDRPDFLVVRAGALRPRFVVVPVDDVEEIVPARRRVVLAGTARQQARA